MKILRGVWALTLALALVLLVGCHPTGRATVDYRTEAFRAEIRWVRGDVTVYAEADTVLEDGVAVLSSVRLLAPPALEGMELVREDEDLVLIRDGIRMTAAGANGWWEAASLLCAKGSLHYVCDTDWEGLTMEYAEIRDGTRRIELLRERETGIPKRVTEGDCSLTVIRFEPTLARG